MKHKVHGADMHWIELGWHANTTLEKSREHTLCQHTWGHSRISVKWEKEAAQDTCFPSKDDRISGQSREVVNSMAAKKCTSTLTVFCRVILQWQQEVQSSMSKALRLSNWGALQFWLLTAVGEVNRSQTRPLGHAVPLHWHHQWGDTRPSATA